MTARRASAAVSRETGARPLTETEAAVLRALIRGQGATPATLAAATELKTNVVGGALSRLSQRGYIEYGEGTVRPVKLPNGRLIPEFESSAAAAAVCAHVAKHGVTKCPPAYVAPVAGADRLARRESVAAQSWRGRNRPGGRNTRTDNSIGVVRSEGVQLPSASRPARGSRAARTSRCQGRS